MCTHTHPRADTTRTDPSLSPLSLLPGSQHKLPVALCAAGLEEGAEPREGAGARTVQLRGAGGSPCPSARELSWAEADRRLPRSCCSVSPRAEACQHCPVE